MTLLELLLEVRRLITPKSCWTQGGSAKSQMGEWLESADSRAAAWCLFGAARRVTLLTPLNETYTGFVEVDQALTTASRMLFGKGYIKVNDDRMTQHEDVLSICDLAVANERKRVNAA